MCGHLARAGGGRGTCAQSAHPPPHMLPELRDTSEEDRDIPGQQDPALLMQLPGALGGHWDPGNAVICHLTNAELAEMNAHDRTQMSSEQEEPRFRGAPSLGGAGGTPPLPHSRARRQPERQGTVVAAAVGVLLSEGSASPTWGDCPALVTGRWVTGGIRV